MVMKRRQIKVIQCPRGTKSPKDAPSPPARLSRRVCFVSTHLPKTMKHVSVMIFAVCSWDYKLNEISTKVKCKDSICIYENFFKELLMQQWER